MDSLRVTSFCIDLVIAAMHNNPSDAELQKYGCEFLSSTSHSHKEYRTMIIHAQGLSAIGEALRIHEGNDEVTFAAQEAMKAISD